MKYKNHTIVIAIVLIVAGISFFAGMQFGDKQTSNGKGQVMMGFGSGEKRGGDKMRFGKNVNSMMPVVGEIISSDGDSIVVKMQEGSSRIVLLSGDSKISKISDGTKEDLKTGDTIFATGKENSDGSITATNISIGGSSMMFRSGMPEGGALQRPE